MENKGKLYGLFCDYFSVFIGTKLLTNPTYIATEKDVEESIDNYQKMLTITLSDDEREYVRNKIKNINAIHQEEGHAILGNYDHDYEWFRNMQKNGLEEYYWERYKNYLINEKHFSRNIISTLEDKTLDKLMSYLGNPNDFENSFSIRGLVVGDVQSGKTSNYLGLITRAVDAGYKVIFVLTGTIESLRKQTQQRIEEGFVGIDASTGDDVGVGRGEKTPKSFTNRLKDFTGTDGQNTSYKISSYPSEPMVFVLKKNVSVLKKLYSCLKRMNTTKQYEKINSSMLMIDDEADNASINTNKEDNDPTKINGYIRKILSLFERSSYVGFTATPFANVFISYDSEDEMLCDDLFPRDFIYSLNPPSNYCGSRKYFFNDNVNVNFIKDGSENIFPMKHDKEWNGAHLFKSFYHSINSFLLINAIRDTRDLDLNTHRSMLINMTRYTRVQLVIKDIVQEYFNNVRNAIKQSYKMDAEYALTNPLIRSLKESFDKEFDGRMNLKITWNDVFENLYKSIKDIQIVVVNSSKQSAKLNYDEYKKTGLRVIAIGGLALSRGLTLEGLCVSYFYRNTATFDVLMQMGRWFGYRDDYDDLCRIFITKTACSYYKEICQSIEYLRRDIEKMEEQNKKPEDFGIRVRNDSIDLGITASNKMRSAQLKIDRKSFFGSIFETPYIDRNLDNIELNIDNTFKLLSLIGNDKRDMNINPPYYRNVSSELIVDFLKSINVNGYNSNFDIKQIVAFILKHESIRLFDVLVMPGEKHEGRFLIKNELGISNPLVQRSYDIKGDRINISGSRARLGGRSDTRYGLDKEDLKNIDKNAKAQDYLLENRNPLLIIYFVDPRNEGMDPEERYTYQAINDEVSLFLELGVRKYSYLVGYAIGFPSIANDVSSKEEKYMVNRTVNYYEKDHENEEGDDCNE